MNCWQQHDLEKKITAILRDVQYTKQDHHFGRPFLTAYQIAQEFSYRFKQDFEAIDLPVGGVGIGQLTSLAQYLAGRLSEEIRAGRIKHIEGSFISNKHLAKMSFKGEDGIFDSSLTETQYDLSIFRLKS